MIFISWWATSLVTKKGKELTSGAPFGKGSVVNDDLLVGVV